jgi:hypothetical protein
LTADFLKGLIKLAAAGVKVLQGQPRGVRSHAGRAAEAFRRTAEALGGEDASYLGLRLGDLVTLAQDTERQAASPTVFAPVLRPVRVDNA